MIKSIKNNFFKKSIISLDQFDRQSILTLFKEGLKIEKNINRYSKILKGKIAGLIFFEPSTRTFSSHAAAFKRLGGQTIEYQNPLINSSAVKGESIEDMMKMFEQYVDILVVRHPIKGTLEKIASIVNIPVINAGDGIGEHPTQTLLDMYTIWKKFNKLTGLTGLIAGDLLNGRTVHSLLKGLSIFPNNKVYLLSPKQLRLDKKDYQEFIKRGLRIIEIESTKEIPLNCHFWYWTRVQKERFTNQKEYEKLKLSFILTKKLVKEKARKETLFMHPLPRVGEIEIEVDSDKRAVYLSEQPRNGMIIRMALFKRILI